MNIVCCKNGHIYSADCAQACPHCSATLRDNRMLPDSVAYIIEENGFEWVKRSGRGDIYRTGPNASLALKITPLLSLPDDADHARCEIDIMRRLKGFPGIMQLLDSGIMPAGETGAVGYAWTVMPWCTPLPEFLRSNSLSCDKRAKIALDLCKALNVCWKSGIAHMDVHPRNVFIDNTGATVLGDFDVSLPIEQLAEHRVVRGSPGYMAPEVYTEGRCSEASDIYSLGILIYGLFNGYKLPFTDTCNTNLAIHRRLLGEQFPVVKCDCPELTAGIISWRSLKGLVALIPTNGFPVLRRWASCWSCSIAERYRASGYVIWQPL